MTIDDLIEDLKENPDFEAATDNILDYVDGSEFFDVFLSAAGTNPLANLKSMIYKNEGNLLNLIKKKKQEFKDYLELKYNGIEGLKPDLGLSNALGVSASKKSIKRECFRLRIFDPELPDDYLEKKRSSEHHTYLNKDIIQDEGQWKKNIRKYINIKHHGIERLKQDGALADHLDVKRSKKSIQRKCFRLKIIDPELPDDYLEKRKMGQHLIYLDKDIIPDEGQWKKNIRKYINIKYNGIEGLKVDEVLANVLGVNYNTNSIQRKCFRLKIFDPELPVDYLEKRKNGTRFIYLSPKIIEAKQLQRNIKKYLQLKYNTINDISINDVRLLCPVLGLDRSEPISKFREVIEEKAWLDTGKFRPYARSGLPDSFKKKKSKTKAKNAKKRDEQESDTASQSTERKNGSYTTFVKGDAFEQLFGLYLSYVHPDQLVIPQYCLDVGDDYYRTRVDFLVGNDFFEVKWGNAVENIDDTFHKHTQLLDKNPGMDYHLVRLENQKKVNVPYQMFENLLEDNINDSDIRQSFETLALLLMESSDDKHNIRDFSFLRHFRDYFFDKIDQANQKANPENRKNAIKDALNEAVSYSENIEKLDDLFVKNTDMNFLPFEAHFHYKGELYRDFISVNEYLKENRPQAYSFGNIEFSRKLDRDIAVLAECSPHLIKIDKALTEPETFQDQPVFTINNDLKISTNGHEGAIRVSTLEEARKILDVSDYWFDFAKDYISECGTEC